MSVSLDKTHELLYFLAVITDAGTPEVKVHHLTLTHDDGYDDLVNGMHDKQRAISGSELVSAVAIDRSAAYTEARRGGSDTEMFNRWCEQEDAKHRP
ncbi:hypothetical protein AB0O57_29635 [Streptomyces sp. NPDC091201]|uniref:hypothetical protein n=1 Tax=Streptomyces sp. NPDC091201 TaxID=3155190 RepID=UPI0034391BD9